MTMNLQNQEPHNITQFDKAIAEAFKHIPKGSKIIHITGYFCAKIMDDVRIYLIEFEVYWQVSVRCKSGCYNILFATEAEARAHKESVFEEYPQ